MSGDFNPDDERPMNMRLEPGFVLAPLFCPVVYVAPQSPFFEDDLAEYSFL